MALEWKINVPDGESVELRHALHKRLRNRVLRVIGGWKSGLVSLCKKTWQLGADDPRRVFHSIKVGIALTLVSLFYFMHPLFDSVGGTAIWAVMTVVVVFEFTVGGTLSKGLNRVLATLLAGALAVGVNFLADLAGDKAEPIILVGSVFLLGSASTFSRFFPTIKTRYDYGVLIFILTFSFISVSGYRVENLFTVAHERLATIMIGCALCVLISVLICPIWAGEDLHKLIIRNLEGLAKSFEGCVTEYFRDVESLGEVHVDDGRLPKGYKCVLNSKATEESLANFARWEPAHGHFGFRYPWKQYVKIGAMMRYCAYCVEALNGCLNSEIQAPYFLRARLKAPCTNIAAECSSVLLELAESIRTMTRCTNTDLMTDRLTIAVGELQNCLRAQPELLIDSKRWHIVQETSTLEELTGGTDPSHAQANKNNSETERLQVSMGKPFSVDCQIANARLIHSKPRAHRRIISWPQELAINVDDSSARDGKLQETERAGVAFLDSLPLATVACLLTEIVARLATVIDAVDELGERAHFKRIDDKVIPVPQIIHVPDCQQTPLAPSKPPPPVDGVPGESDQQHVNGDHRHPKAPGEANVDGDHGEINSLINN